MKLICNKCYAQELKVHDYDGKLYVDPCSECAKEEHGDGFEEGWQEGWQEGLEESKED